MRCRRCHAELMYKTAYCLNCGYRNALGCGVYAREDKICLFFIGEDIVETISFKLYEEEKSVINMFELIAERIHERRVDETYISGSNHDLIESTFEMVKRYSLSPLRIFKTDVFEDSGEFLKSLTDYLRTKRELKRVYMRPEKKIHGSHSTIIGGKIGLKFIEKIARSEFVKKIVPGVIEAKGTASGGGVRFKLTRCDERGNIRALLINGATVQEIHIITTARNKEEGEIVLKILKGFID